MTLIALLPPSYSPQVGTVSGVSCSVIKQAAVHGERFELQNTRLESRSQKGKFQPTAPHGPELKVVEVTLGCGIFLYTM